MFSIIPGKLYRIRSWTHGVLRPKTFFATYDEDGFTDIHAVNSVKHATVLALEEPMYLHMRNQGGEYHCFKALYLEGIVYILTNDVVFE